MWTWLKGMNNTPDGRCWSFCSDKVEMCRIRYACCSKELLPSWVENLFPPSFWASKDYPIRQTQSEQVKMYWHPDVHWELYDLELTLRGQAGGRRRLITVIIVHILIIAGNVFIWLSVIVSRIVRVVLWIHVLLSILLTLFLQFEIWYCQYCESCYAYITIIPHI